jgi:hypothetical protein
MQTFPADWRLSYRTINAIRCKVSEKPGSFAPIHPGKFPVSEVDAGGCRPAPVFGLAAEALSHGRLHTDLGT